LAFVMWIIMIIPLRIMTDFGEPLIPDKQWIAETLEEQNAKKSPRQQERQMAIGGLSLAFLIITVSVVLWIAEMGSPWPGFIFALIFTTISLKHLWRWSTMPKEDRDESS